MTQVLPSIAENSTTGRSSVVRLAQLELAVADRISPELAGRSAARLFTSPRRFRRPETEKELLAAARPFRVNGLAAWRWGGGPPVLLVHGWEGRGAQLGAFVDPLVQQGFSVVTFDAPAHGDSSGSRANLADFATAIAAVSERVGGARAVVAHSFGSLGTLLAVRRGLAPEGVVLIAPPSPAERVAWFRETFSLSDDAFAVMLARVEDAVGVSFEGVEGTHLAKDLATPGLVVHDRGDKEVAWRNGADIAAAWPGATLLTTEGLGHRRILRDRDVIRTVTEFVVKPRASA